MNEETNSVGAPRTYTLDDALKIIEIYAQTVSGLDDICGKHGLMSRAQFYRWKDEHEELRDAYVRAKRMHMDLMAYETIKIADDSSNDFYEDAKGNKKLDNEHVLRSRLRVDTRFKLLEFLSNQDKSKENTGAPVTVIISPSGEKP